MWHSIIFKFGRMELGWFSVDIQKSEVKNLTDALQAELDYDCADTWAKIDIPLCVK